MGRPVLRIRLQCSTQRLQSQSSSPGLSLVIHAQLRPRPRHVDGRPSPRALPMLQPGRASAWRRSAERVARVVIVSGSIASSMILRPGLLVAASSKAGAKGFGARGDARGKGAIGAGEGGEVGVLQRRADDATGKAAFLVHADRAVHRVVEQQDDRPDAGGELYRLPTPGRSSGSRHHRKSRPRCARDRPATPAISVAGPPAFCNTAAQGASSPRPAGRWAMGSRRRSPPSWSIPSASWSAFAVMAAS